MTKEDKLDALINTKAFDQLTNDERMFVLEELGSETQYDAMRKVSLALITSKVELSPDPRTLLALQGKMKDRYRQQDHQAWGRTILAWRLPAYAASLLVLAVAVSSWWIGRRNVEKAVRIVETVRRDTIFVASTPDTVFKDRFIYRTIVKKEIQKDVVYLVRGAEPPSSDGIGVSMKEKQDLELLLVSGSK
jgi:hypothetical protein